MMNFVSNIGKQVFYREDKKPTDEILQFLRSRKAILKELVRSRENRTVIGVYAAALGEGMFITSVDDIYVDDTEEIIVLKRYDLSGLILPRTELSLSEIQAICPFDLVYKNPVIH